MPDWTIPAKSFDSTTLPGTYVQGSAIDLEQVMTEHACQVVVVTANAGDQAQVHLEGSLDGANWYLLGSAGVPAGGAPGAGTFTALISASGQAALFVRSNGYGSGSPVVTTYHTSGKV